MTDGRIDAGGAAYRGFLFSDIRGFTAFAERHGNKAAADAVSRFLDLARNAIARHEGAEVKTEGDAIHAVFPSASSAVLCGLEIVDAAAELNAREPDRPLGLGVGVHAGEAVETAEGYIGRAVNIAARLCAAARPGEVLVSSTVKGITQASIPVGFIPRGRRRLKGIQDPIVVYAVTRDTSAVGERELPRAVVVGGAAVAIVALAGIALFAGSRLLGNPGSSADASPPGSVAPAQPLAIGELRIATYESQGFQPPLEFTIGEEGWTASRDTPDLLGLVRVDPPRGSLSFLRVQEVIGDPCLREGTGIRKPPSALTLLIQVENLTHLSVSERQPVAVGGYTGQQVDISIPPEVLAACGGLAGGDVGLFIAGNEVVGFMSGERFRLISLAVGEQTVAIVTRADWTQTPSVPEFESVLQQGQLVIDSVRF
jgi:class 3 adenylate cyclase